MSPELNYHPPDVSDRWRMPLRRLGLTSVIIAAVLICVHLAPFIVRRWHSVLPTQLGNALFFVPQTALPYDALVRRDATGSRALFTHSTGHVLNVLHWLALVIVLTLITKRLRLSWALSIVIVAAFAIAFVGPLVFEPFGVTLELDGP